SAEVIHTQQRGLAALPGKRHNGYALAFDVLADVDLENLVRHLPVRSVWVQLFLFKIEAILAIEISNGTNGLRPNVEAREPTRRFIDLAGVALHHSLDRSRNRSRAESDRGHSTPRPLGRISSHGSTPQRCAQEL